MPERIFTAEYCAPFFLVEKGFRFKTVPAASLDRVKTVRESKMRCIDRRAGMTKNGYAPESVSPAPALPGAIESVIAFAKAGLIRDDKLPPEGDHPEVYVEWAVDQVRALGYEPEMHGDLLAKRRGCRYREALKSGIFGSPGQLTEFDYEFMALKFGVHYTELFPEAEPAEAIVLNHKAHSTVRPDGGRFYPVDVWAAAKLGILAEPFMQTVAKCAELLLHGDQKNILFVED